MYKNKRLEIVRSILNEDKIHSQVELKEKLKKSGLKISQSTLSRDLKELGYISLTTTATPNYVFNYNYVYPAVGFDFTIFRNQLSKDDMDGPWVSDKEVLKENLKYVKIFVEKKKPIFNYVI